MKKYCIILSAIITVFIMQSCSEQDILDNEETDAQTTLPRQEIDFTMGGESQTRLAYSGLTSKTKLPVFHWEKGNMIMIKDVTYNSEVTGYVHDTIIITNKPMEHNDTIEASGHVYANINDEVRMFYPHNFLCRKNNSNNTDEDSLTSDGKTFIKLDVSNQDGSFYSKNFLQNLLYMRSLKYKLMQKQTGVKTFKNYFARKNSSTGRWEEMNTTDKFYPLISMLPLRFFDNSGTRIALTNAVVTIKNVPVKAKYDMDNDPIDLSVSAGSVDPELEFTEFADLTFTGINAETSSDKGTLDVVLLANPNCSSYDFIIQNNPGKSNEEYYEGTLHDGYLKYAGKFIKDDDSTPYRSVTLTKQENYKIGMWYNQDGTITETPNYPVGIVYGLSLTKDGVIDNTLKTGPHCRIIALEDLKDNSGYADMPWNSTSADIPSAVYGDMTDVCGRDNTETLYEMCVKEGDGNAFAPAFYAHEYSPTTVSTKGEWYLPSVSELYQLQNDNVRNTLYDATYTQQGTYLYSTYKSGNDYKYYNYWSSTVATDGSAYYFDPNIVETNVRSVTSKLYSVKKTNRTNKYRVRAILSK